MLINNQFNFIIKIGDCEFKSVSKPFDLSIHINPNDQNKQVNAFNLPRAVKQTFQCGNFIADVSQGGSINCDQISLWPHANGTHTECVGHVTSQKITIEQALQAIGGVIFVPALIISIEPQPIHLTQDLYPAIHQNEELVISKQLIETAIINATFQFSQSIISSIKAIIIRTLPNDDSKKNRIYQNNNAPYFTPAATSYLRNNHFSFQHILVDLPSLDREV
eukprot:TRINITY_DN3714_c0_g1_i2.p1 TRINITY_DN3714_c0_g1~~TRINITY_DN3714_c0_g1_i2.p1  ORF type:complete len:221 (+),score=86.40 TRINITY_DN3714_c0_g1_i2:39-701(+)